MHYSVSFKVFLVIFNTHMADISVLLGSLANMQLKNLEKDLQLMNPTHYKEAWTSGPRGTLNPRQDE